MSRSNQSEGYTIWQTQSSIQLSVTTKPEKQASLICKCRNYQSALRVAGELANQLHLPLVLES